MRLEHTCEIFLQALAKQCVLKGAKTCKLDFCESNCVIEKKAKVKFGTVTHCTEGILDYIHTYVWGPTKTSIGGNRYFVSFIDDYSKRCWVYTMKNKREILELFVE